MVSMSIAEQIKEMKRIERVKSEWYQRQLGEQIRKAREVADAFRRNFLPHLPVALPINYARWLVGFIRNGGQPTHFYDYELPSNFYLATFSFGLPPLYGSDSVNLIVLPGVQIKYDSLGHSHLFHLSDSSTDGESPFVPVYESLPIQEAENERLDCQ